MWNLQYFSFLPQRILNSPWARIVKSSYHVKKAICKQSRFAPWWLSLLLCSVASGIAHSNLPVRSLLQVYQKYQTEAQISQTLSIWCRFVAQHLCQELNHHPDFQARFVISLAVYDSRNYLGFEHVFSCLAQWTSEHS